MKILFITANRLGDAVLSSGVLAWLIKQHPNAEITIACGSYAAGLFRAVPGLQRLIILNKKSYNRHWLELWKACIGIRWDIVVDMRNSIVSRLLFTRRNVSKGRSTGQHKVVENAAVLKITPPPAPQVWFDAHSEKAAAQIIGGAKKILALGPAANWPCKQWPIERFAELAQRMIADDGLFAGASVMIVADERERAQIAPLLMAIPDARRMEVLGHDLQVVAACLKQAQLFVGNDSGLMHLAAAVGTRTLGLFGPGYEDVYGPWGDYCAFVRTSESRVELLARLPHIHAREPNLMTGLTVEKVYEAALFLASK